MHRVTAHKYLSDTLLVFPFAQPSESSVMTWHDRNGGAAGLRSTIIIDWGSEQKFIQLSQLRMHPLSISENGRTPCPWYSLLSSINRRKR